MAEPDPTGSGGPHKAFGFHSKGNWKPQRGFRQERDMVRFIFLEVPLRFWVGSILQGSRLQEG